MKNTPTLATNQQLTPYEAAVLLIDAIRYELPLGQPDAYWIDKLANAYAVLHSDYRSNNYPAAYLPQYIREDAATLLDSLELNLHPVRRLYVVARLELDIATLAGADESVITQLLEVQKARQNEAIDAYLAEEGPPDPPMERGDRYVWWGVLLAGLCVFVGLGYWLLA